MGNHRKEFGVEHYEMRCHPMNDGSLAGIILFNRSGIARLIGKPIEKSTMELIPPE